MNFSSIWAKLVEEFYALDPGVMIDNPSDFVYFSHTVRISRRGFKHVVEMRKEEKYPVSRIQQMCSRVAEVFDVPDIRLKNTNKRHVDSYRSKEKFERMLIEK